MARTVSCSSAPSSPRSRLVALRFERPVIHAVLDAGAFQGRVAVPRPGFPPAFQKLGLVPVAVLGGEALRVDLTGGQQDVGVMVALVTLTPRRVQGDVSHHAAIYELRLRVVADQGDTLRIRRVVRCEDFGVIDAALGRVIEGQPGAAVLDPLGHAVGGSRRDAAALTAGNHRSSKMVDLKAT